MQANGLIFLGVSLFVAACSSGGRTLVPNQQCPADYDPVPMKVADTDQNKITWEKTTDVLPPGDYKEVGALLYYVDDEMAATKQNFRVKIQESQTKDGSYQVDTTANCARNARPGLKLDFATEGVTRMTIDNNKVVTDTETRVFKFNTNDAITGKFEAPQKKTGTEPKAVYQGKTENAFVYKKTDWDYELRSQGRYDNGNTHGTYYLLTTLRRAAVPTCSEKSPLAIAKDEKTEESKLTLDRVGEVTPGAYTLVSTSVYVVDKAQKFSLQVQDKPAAGRADSRVLCERGAGADLKAKGLVLPDTISQLTVDENHVPSIEYVARRLSFQRADNRTAVEFKVTKNASTTGTTDAEARAVTGNPVVYRIDNDETLEIRSHGVTTIGGQTVAYEVTTVLKRN